MVIKMCPNQREFIIILSIVADICFEIQILALESQLLFDGQEMHKPFLISNKGKFEGQEIH